MRDLPPLKMIEAFEAAARHLNFTRAAGELNVLQPAVSRQVMALEAELGTRLFERTKPALTLTPDGQTMFAAVSAGVEQIRGAVYSIDRRRHCDRLVVNMAIGFASCFLIARLADFVTAYPEIEIQLVTRDTNEGYDPRQCDVVVYFGGPEGLPGAQNLMVMRERLMAICTPAYLDRRCGGAPVAVEELSNYRLLHLTPPEHIGDWDTYLAGTGVAAPAPDGLAVFNSFMVYLKSIENADGIGLGWGGLYDDMIEIGRLVRACERTVKTNRGYHVCLMDRALGNKNAMTFVEWLSTLCS